MSDSSGTIQEKDGHNLPSTLEDLQAQVSRAVSEGKMDEVDRLLKQDFEFSAEPDATDDSTDQTDPALNEPEKDDKVVPAKDPIATKVDANPVTATPAVAAPAVPTNADYEAKLAKLEQELHRVKSAAGRVDSLQQKLTAFEKKQAEQEAAEAKALRDGKTRKSDEQLNKLKEIDPDLAALLTSMREEQDALSTREQAQAPAQDQADPLQSEYQRVLKVHTDAPEIFTGKGRPAWDKWKATLTDDQLAWAESDSAEQVVIALSAFKQAMQQARQATPAATTPVEAVVEATPDATQQARERKLQGTASTRNTVIKTQGGQDKEAMFKEVYDSILKEDGIK